MQKHIYLFIYLGGYFNTQPYQIPVHSGEGRAPLNTFSIIPLLSDFCDNGNTIITANILRHINMAWNTFKSNSGMVRAR